MYDVRFIFCVVVTCALRSSTETHDNLKLDQIFRTPKDFSKVNFDHLEILERNNFDPQINPDPENEALSSHSKLHPKSVANAQVMLRFGGDDIKGTNHIDKNLPEASPVVAKVGQPYPLQPSPHHHHPYHHLTNEIKTPYHPTQYLPPYGQHYAPMQYGQYFVPPYIPYQYPPNMYYPGCNCPYLPYGLPTAPGFLPNESFYSGHPFLDNSHQRNIVNTINVNRPKILKTADLSNDVIPENNENVNPQDNRGPVLYPSSSGVIMHSRPREIMLFTKENINQPYSAFDFMETGNPQEISHEHDKTILIEYDTHIDHSSPHEYSKLHHNLKVRPIHEKIEDNPNYPHYHYIIPESPHKKHKKEEKTAKDIPIPAHIPQEHGHIQHISKKHHIDLDSVKKESPINITPIENESSHPNHVDHSVKKESPINITPIENESSHPNHADHSVKKESPINITPIENESSHPKHADHSVKKESPIDMTPIENESSHPNHADDSVKKETPIDITPIENESSHPTHADDDQSHILCIPRMHNKKNKKVKKHSNSHPHSVKKESESVIVPVDKDSSLEIDHHNKHPHNDVVSINGKIFQINKEIEENKGPTKNDLPMHIESVEKDLPCNIELNDKDANIDICIPVHQDNTIETLANKEESVHILSVDKDAPVDESPNKEASVSVHPVKKETPIINTVFKDAAIYIKPVDKEVPIENTVYKEESINIQPVDKEKPITSSNDKDSAINILHVNKERPIQEDTPDELPLCETEITDHNHIHTSVNHQEIPSCSIKADEISNINPNSDYSENVNDGFEQDLIKDEEPIIINPFNDQPDGENSEAAIIKIEEPINIDGYEVNEDIKNEEPINIDGYEVNEDIKNEEPINIKSDDIVVLPDNENSELVAVKQEEPINIVGYEVNQYPIDINSNDDNINSESETIKQEAPINIVGYEVNEDIKNEEPINIKSIDDIAADLEPAAVKQEEPINIVGYEVNEDPISINPNDAIAVNEDSEPETIKQEEPISIVGYEVNEGIKNEEPINIESIDNIAILPDNENYEPETIKQEEPINIVGYEVNEEPINIDGYEVNEDIKNEEPINIDGYEVNEDIKNEEPINIKSDDIVVLPDNENSELVAVKQEEPINIVGYEVNQYPIDINSNDDNINSESETIKQEAPINIVGYEVNEDIKNEEPINIKSIDDIAADLEPAAVKQEEPINIVGYEVNEDPISINPNDAIAVNEDSEPETIKQEEPISIVGYEVNEGIKNEEPINIESIDNIAILPDNENYEPETIKQEEPINIVGYEVNEEPININPNDNIDVLVDRDNSEPDTIKSEDPIVIIPTDDIILLPDNDRFEPALIKEEEPTIIGYEVNEDDRSLLDSVKNEEPININPVDVLPEGVNSEPAAIKQEDPNNILGYEVNEGPISDINVSDNSQPDTVKNEDPISIKPIGDTTVLLDNEDSDPSTIKEEDPVNIVGYDVIENVNLPDSIKNEEDIIINPTDNDNSVADSIKQEDTVYINPTDNVGYEVNDIIGNIPLLETNNEDQCVIQPSYIDSVNEEFPPLEIIVKDPDSCKPVSESDCAKSNKVHFIDVELSRPQKGCKEVEEWLNNSLVPYECNKCGKKLLVSYPITGHLDSHIIPITESDVLDVATLNCPCCKLKGFCDCQNCQCNRKPTIPYGKRFDEDVDSLFKIHNDNSNWNPTYPYNIWDHLETTPQSPGFTHSFKKTSLLGFTRVGNQEPEITYNGFLSHSGGGSLSDPFQNIFCRQRSVVDLVSKPDPCTCGVEIDQYEIPHMYQITPKYKIIPKQIQPLRIPELVPTETFTCCKLPYPNNNKIVCQRQYLAGNHPILIEN